MSALPPEVIEAYQRLSEPLVARHQIVQQPNIPTVFRAIIDNDNERTWIRERSSAMTQADWCRLKELRDDRRKNLVPSAEKMLAWNTDKGNPQGPNAGAAR